MAADMGTKPELIYELIITVINLLSIVANVLLIITITRSKFMRTRTNLYILNVSVADLMTLLVLLVYYVNKRIVRYFDRFGHVQCVLTDAEITLQIVTVCFVIILLCNFLFTNKCISQGIFVVLIWNLSVVTSYFNVLYCNDEMTLAMGASYAALLAILLLLLMIKYCQRCRNKGDVSRDGAFRLNFATIFACLCLSSWIVNIVAEFGFANESIFKHFVLAFGTSVKVGKNIALTLYLFKYNETYKDSLMALFNCRSVKINESINYSNQQTSLDFAVRNNNEKIVS